jgi:hypothetical protein
MPGATTITTTTNNNIKSWNTNSSSICIAVIETNIRVSGHACTVSKLPHNNEIRVQ